MTKPPDRTTPPKHPLTVEKGINKRPKPVKGPNYSQNTRPENAISPPPPKKPPWIK